jgi:hypothetical protein
MSSTTAFAAHARGLAAALQGLTKDLLQEIHREMHELALQKAIAVTPLGGAGDKHPGQMKRSWRSMPVSIGEAINRQQPTKIQNTAPHGLIIDRGRRRSENAWQARRPGVKGVGRGRKKKFNPGLYYTVKAGKILGSTQAVLGVKGQVLRELAAQEDAIFARAAAAVDRKAGR